MTNKKNLFKTIKVVFPCTLPVLTGFLVLGIAYGMLMQSKGYGPMVTGFMSAIAYCGSMQFVAITILTTAFDPLQALMLSIMVNARHIFYGLSLLEKYRGLGFRKFFCIYTLCDESFSIISSIDPPNQLDNKDFYFIVSMLDWSYWVIGGVLGGIIGNLIQFNTQGLDFALTALFVVLLLEQIRKSENIIPAIIGVVVSVICLIVFRPDNFVIPSMIALIVTLLVGRDRLCH